MVFSYSTILAPTQAEIKERGSRFLSFAFPVANKEMIKEQLTALKKAHPKANHHCVAFRLGTDGQNFRANDDGEPSGSAGRPMLGQIDSMGLTNVLVVVVRYFGGTLLGVPGLIAAYREVAALALSKAVVIERPILKNVQLDFEYPQLSMVMGWQKQFGAEILSQDMGLFCQMALGVPLASWKDFQALLINHRDISIKEL